ncbi:hypothetical protein [uncultured Tateyamaria sp.]|uniref:hypothetical protein n=1 Tax=uncultured Tateyamaria sp. TaxID=455651 RepID=UPI0026313A69|nr:hypothetical protein [uncultured Tateyamaria sp.]
MVQLVGMRGAHRKGHCVSNRVHYAAVMRWMMITAVSLTGCGLVPERWTADPADPVGEARGGVSADVLVRPQARPAVPPVAPVLADGALGRTIATLGNAGEPGLWLRTPLVPVESAGRVKDAGTGAEVSVTLIPIDGPATAGSRMSLQAMQALGVGLTDLVEIDVFVDS